MIEGGTKKNFFDPFLFPLQDARLNSTMITFMATMLKDAHRLAAKTALVSRTIFRLLGLKKGLPEPEFGGRSQSVNVTSSLKSL